MFFLGGSVFVLLILARFGNGGRRPGQLVSVLSELALLYHMVAPKWKGSGAHLGGRILDLFRICWNCSNVVDGVSYTSCQSDEWLDFLLFVLF